MIKIAICDDETAFLTELSAMLRSWAASRELVLQLFPFTNGDKLIAACEESPADLVILDIMMPFPGGMDTAKALRQKESHVPLIFLTSSPEFALESYEVRAFWYLLNLFRKNGFSLCWINDSPPCRRLFAISQPGQSQAIRISTSGMWNIWRPAINWLPSCFETALSWKSKSPSTGAKNFSHRKRASTNATAAIWWL